jgi:hypothetical protein
MTRLRRVRAVATKDADERISNEGVIMDEMSVSAGVVDGSAMVGPSTVGLHYQDRQTVKLVMTM